MKKGFTLSEVLITLGVIGIVAAITLPTLIHKIQSIVLENQFKTSLATANQIIISAKRELEVDNLNSYCTAYNGDYYNAQECIKAFNNALIKKGKSKNSYQYLDITRDDIIRTYNNKENFYNSGCYDINQVTELPNASYMSFRINCHTVSISIDVNGAKRPNIVGHDIFVLKLNDKDFISGYAPFIPEANKGYAEETKGNPCNLESTQQGNGFGCGHYALQDVCPQTGKKGYFKCLPR